MRNRLGTAALASTLLLAGCSGAPLARDESTASPTPSPTTATSSAAPEASPTDEPSRVAPNIGDAALQLGQPRKGRYITSTVLEIRQGAPSPDYAQPDPGQEWTIVRAKQCAKPDSPEPVPTSTVDYIGLDDDGGEYQVSGTSWDGWPPTPTYPSDRTISAGQCVSGWILFQVAKGQRFTKVALSDGGGGFAAEWIV